MSCEGIAETQSQFSRGWWCGLQSWEWEGRLCLRTLISMSLQGKKKDVHIRAELPPFTNLGVLYINNNIPRSLIPSLGLCARVLQTIFLWCVHNKHTNDCFSDSLVLLLFFSRLNFGQFPLPYVDQVSSQPWFDCSVSGQVLFCLLGCSTGLCYFSFCYGICKILLGRFCSTWPS